MTLKRNTLSRKEQIILFKQFGTLMQNGVSLVESLEAMKNYARGYLASVLSDLIDQVNKGRSLSKALKQYNDFANSTINLVEIGEAGGTLAENLVLAAKEMQDRQAAKKKIASSLMYPVIVTSATLAMVTLLILYVFPKILPVFSSVNLKLPLTTRLLVGMNEFLLNHTIAIISIVLVSIAAIIFCLTTRRLKKLRDYYILKIPFINSLVRNYFLAQFCRTFGQLLQQNIPLIRALMITAHSTKNSIYKQKIIELSLAVNHGQSVNQFLQEYPKIFPPLLTQMVAIGERTGTLDKNFIFLSDIYEQDTTETLSRISVIIEPAMMIAIGVLVGFIAISIISPLYQVTQNIHA